VCLLVFAWRIHPDYPLVLAGNRDEFHARPAAPAGWWPEHEGVLAGRDLQAGGTWLGVHRQGHVAVVTNFREPAQDTAGRRSRGELVVDFLTRDEPVDRWAAGLARRRDEYGGFNLLAGDADGLHYLTNRGADVLDLPPGLYGLSNHRLDTPWPKVEMAKARLAEAIDGERLAKRDLFRILADRTQAADSELPDTGVPLAWERLLSAAFIVSPEYGTRVSTVVLADRHGRIEFEERRYDGEGEPVGESRYSLEAATGPRGTREESD
jgi:uncharacterized protein with NRDE domain